jgi:radical SAM superfamily enzyme YgiQ (UPF0313 family)
MNSNGVSHSEAATAGATARRSMKVALVLPPFSAKGAEEGADSFGKMRPWPPLGLGMLASVLENRGHRPVILDAIVRRHSVNGLAEALLAEKPDVLGISCITICAPACHELARIVRARSPRCLIVIGGPHITCFQEHALSECPEADVAVPGEAEYVFADLVDAHAGGLSPQSVAGLFCRDEKGDVVSTGPTHFHRELDTLPNPAWALFDRHLYKALVNQSRRSPAANVITARGCPWARCAFCYNGGRFAYPYRRRSPENVLGEIKMLVQVYGYREITFWDDDFCNDNAWVTRFCDLLEAENVDITWSVQARVTSISEALLARMAARGCYNIFFGLESGNQELLNLVKKGITLDLSRKAVAAARKAGMEARASFMLGLPTETPEMSLKTIRFACELNLDYVVFVPFHPQKGTCLEELALARGRVIPVEKFNMVAPTYCPDSYPSPEALDRMVRRAYMRYYLRPRFILLALGRLRHGGGIRGIAEGMGHLAALVFRRNP